MTSWEYTEELRRRFSGPVDALDGILEAALNEAGVEHLLEGRVKTPQSVTEKIERKGYTDPFNQITDFAGLRIVVPSLADVERVGEMLSREFGIDDSRSVTKGSELRHDQFGYQGDHYVLRLKDARLDQVEHQDHKDLWAEVQVRTILQDAWARGSHFLPLQAGG